MQDPRLSRVLLFMHGSDRLGLPGTVPTGPARTSSGRTADFDVDNIGRNSREGFVKLHKEGSAYVNMLTASALARLTIGPAICAIVFSCRSARGESSWGGDR